MALKGLTKKISEQGLDARVNTAEAEAFISGAKIRSNETVETQSAAVFKRTTFSLSDEINEQIDKLSLLPRSFRAGRSDVVRAAVALLASQPESDVVELLKVSQVRGKSREGR